jgi:hypothetical protein
MILEHNRFCVRSEGQTLCVCVGAGLVGAGLVERALPAIGLLDVRRAARAAELRTRHEYIPVGSAPAPPWRATVRNSAPGPRASAKCHSRARPSATHPCSHAPRLGSLRLQDLWRWTGRCAPKRLRRRTVGANYSANPPTRANLACAPFMASRPTAPGSAPAVRGRRTVARHGGRAAEPTGTYSRRVRLPLTASAGPTQAKHAVTKASHP